MISEEVKKAAPLIFNEIKKANSILLHCHPSPDPDSVGSVLAMKFALEALGKKVTAIKGDSDISMAFMHFPGAHSIIKKSFEEVDQKDFDLFIILDSGGIEMVSSKVKVEFQDHLKTIVIDHHDSNKGYGHINLVDFNSPATAFTLYQLFNEWDMTLNREISLNLFMGMYTDTGGFKYGKTDWRILEAASVCAKVAPDFPEIIFQMENSEVKEFIYFVALALNSIETFCNGNVAISSIPHDMLLQKGIPAGVVRGDFIPNMLKSVIGWNIGVTIFEVEPTKCKVSFRTRDPQLYDVSRVAVVLGGGGHKGASGAGLMMGASEARELVVSKIKELYNL